MSLRRSVLNYVRENGELTDKFMKMIVEKTEQDRRKRKERWDLYCLSRGFEGRKVKNPDEDNERQVYVDFLATIVDTKVAYILSQPIQYNVNDNTSNINIMNDFIDDYKFDNNTDILDVQTGKMMSVTGYAGRLLNMNDDKEIEVVNIPSWELYFLYEDRSDKNEAAIRYYQDVDEDGNTYWTFILYTEEGRVKYVEESAGSFSFREVDNLIVSFFDLCPLIEFKNNDERIGDADRVWGLISGLNDSIEDVRVLNREKRDPIRIFKGAKPPQDFRNQIGDRYLHLKGKDDDFEYKTKDFDHASFEYEKDFYLEHIHKHSYIPDMSDVNFAGQQTGVAMAYKMMMLENNAGMFVKYFVAGLRRQFQVIQSFLKTEGLGFNYKKLDYVFTRNLPKNLSNEAELINKLFDKLPLKTLYSIVSVVPDAQDAVRQMVKEGKVDKSILETDDFSDLTGEEKKYFEGLIKEKGEEVKET